jgi:hypothetical protein
MWNGNPYTQHFPSQIPSGYYDVNRERVGVEGDDEKIEKLYLKILEDEIINLGRKSNKN